mgnify:CR=1 FL=1
MVNIGYKGWITLWLIFSASIIYWDINKHKDNIPLSECHLVGIIMYHGKPMCTECKLFCEVKK